MAVGGGLEIEQSVEVRSSIEFILVFRIPIGARIHSLCFDTRTRKFVKTMAPENSLDLEYRCSGTGVICFPNIGIYLFHASGKLYRRVSVDSFELKSLAIVVDVFE